MILAKDYSSDKKSGPIATGELTLEVGNDKDQAIAAAIAKEDEKGAAEQVAKQAEVAKLREAGFVHFNISHKGTSDDCFRVDAKWGQNFEANADDGWLKPGSVIRVCATSVPAEGCAGACTTTRCFDGYTLTEEPDQQFEYDCATAIAKLGM